MNTNQDKIAKLESIITLLSKKIDKAGENVEKQRKSSEELLSESMIDEREEAYSQKN